MLELDRIDDDLRMAQESSNTFEIPTNNGHVQRRDVVAHEQLVTLLESSVLTPAAMIPALFSNSSIAHKKNRGKETEYCNRKEAKKAGKASLLQR